MATPLRIQTFSSLPSTKPHSIRLSPPPILRNRIPKHHFPTHFRVCSKQHSLTGKSTPLVEKPPKDQLGHSPFLLIPLPCLAFASIVIPSLAAETGAAAPDKLNVEAIVVAIDDFFNRNPFFVAGVTFIWLVVIPLTQNYLKKCKPISAIDAFRKLRDVPSCQLLDIRSKKSLRFMGSPNLKLLSKTAAQVEFVNGQEEKFLKEVLGFFPDPANTVLCVLDNFDGESLKVAEVLHKNGFKEAYSIEGGLRGNDGWQAIQETLLPPSMHVYPRKEMKPSMDMDNESKVSENDDVNGQLQFSLGTVRNLTMKSESDGTSSNTP